ncbi:hypothetical protein J7E93_23105 [Streptomyces sp. ISL-36]|uniref:LamG-like jellyroll fold domain-containing protein n=1 Tax=Streptomyces sp. ISL-36 TaxID=2819182 RepID=UPI001BEC3F18|nr:LamG-like jellyroll fold domain-containing protein [Streptomyces sp. ISL-36]MBT2442942.1 hypothetical protein [Streptomyces sp. ISL-36]
MRRSAASWLHMVAAVLATVLTTAVLLGAQAIPAAALTTTPGDPAGNGYTRESVRAMTWNICGEAGGTLPSSGGFCPFRNDPKAKAKAIGDVVRARNLNAIMLQEVCSGPRRTEVPDTGAPSQLDEIAAQLGKDTWSFRWAEVWRPAGTSYCRGGLTGTLSVAIGVKGRITWSDSEVLPVPLGTQQNRGQVLCAEAAGWENHLCATHVSNFGQDVELGQMSQDRADQLYEDQIETIRAMAAKFPSVVLGGDFNTRLRDRLQPLYDTMAECDQRSYLPGDASNEVTKYTPAVASKDANEAITDPSYETSKIDYLFSTSGFSGCDSWTQMADQADYTLQAQPDCHKNATPIVCTPTGTSDHTPLYGHTRGAPTLSWKLDGSPAGTSGGSGGHSGTLTAGASWTTDHGGAVALNGSTGTVTAAGPVVDTTRSFTVSAWAKVEPGAGTSVVLSQDGSVISGMMLWYNQPDNTWRFGLPKSDSGGWSVDQAISRTQAKPGVWTRLTAVHDAASGVVTLYVDGVEAGTTTHPTRWAADGPFVVGRDKVNGAGNAYFHGAVQRVEVYDHPMTATEAASHAGRLTAPTGRQAQPSPDAPGCHQAGGYGTVHSLTPTLTARVTHPDPSKEVWAEFSVWDNTDPSLPQPLRMSGPGSASAKVRGDGTVSVTVPGLVEGHSYGWWVRTVDGATASPTAAVCHFRATAG